MTHQLTKLKDEISETLGIIGWNPSELILRTIAREISKTPPKTLADLTGIVIRICPGHLTISTEGVDNSDLRVVLALAIAAATKG